jgi:hypothetical protein
MSSFSFRTPQQSLIGLLVTILIFIGVFYLLGWVYKGLAYVAPFLLIATAIINYKIIIEFGNLLIDTLRKNPIFGIIAIVLSVIGFPVVAFYLFAKALIVRKIKKTVNEFEQSFKGFQGGMRQEETQEVDYEELESKINRPQSIQDEKKKNNPYDSLFEN